MMMLPLLGLIIIPTLSTAFISPYNLLQQSYNTCCATMGSLSWTSGTDILNSNPSSLSNCSNSRPQLAKDEEYASAILTAWKEEVATRNIGGDETSVSSPITYQCNDKSSLYGHIYRRSSSTFNNDTIEERSVPGIILFHTGAGPQDIFLRWKADSLVVQTGCVVLIADILGDETGWAWHDRDKYGTVRKKVLLPDVNGERKQLVSRVQAAIDTISTQHGVDKDRIGVMGFCLGGHPVLELARTNNPSVKALVTFHGVFDSIKKLIPVSSCHDVVKDCNVLVCSGADDPFVADEDLSEAMSTFNNLGYQSKLMKFDNTKHGFTNPAQDFNQNDAFAYNDEAYHKSWSAALELMKSL